MGENYVSTIIIYLHFAKIPKNHCHELNTMCLSQKKSALPLCKPPPQTTTTNIRESYNDNGNVDFASLTLTGPLYTPSVTISGGDYNQFKFQQSSETVIDTERKTDRRGNIQ